MKGNKKASEGAMGSVVPPRPAADMAAASSLNADATRPRFPQDEKPRQAPVSERPAAYGKSEDAARKNKKKGIGDDEKWPFASITPQDMDNEIRERAFYIYLQRGPEGNPKSDWLQAEAEIKRKYGIGK
jgi:hypothetical protein